MRLSTKIALPVIFLLDLGVGAFLFVSEGYRGVELIIFLIPAFGGMFAFFYIGRIGLDLLTGRARYVRFSSMSGNGSYLPTNLVR